jgi:guanine deaminase
MCAKTRALQAPVLQALQAPAPAPAGSFARKQLPVAALLHLATLGGARVCALEDRVGSLAPGKAFDALLVSVRAGCGNPAVWGPDLDEELGVGRTQTLKDMLERFLFGGDDRNIRKVFVQGRCIGGADAGK